MQLEGTQGSITLRRTPETAAWAADYGIRLEQDRTFPILGIYNEYVDVCIGEIGASFHPVVYLLTKDGVVEYVDVLRCLISGNVLVCQDPSYIANNGVALERSGSEVNLHQEDGSVLELAPLTEEWNGQEIPWEAVGAFNEMGVSTSETEDGMPGITFVAAVKYDLFNETLNLTMIDGENPFAEGKPQLQLIRCPDY